MGIQVGGKSGVQQAAATQDARTETLASISTLFSQLPANGYYLRQGGEKLPLNPENIAKAIAEMGKGNGVEVVKDEGKGRGWGTTSKRRQTGDPVIARLGVNMFQQASAKQLTGFEVELRAAMAAPEQKKGWQ